MEGTIVAIRLTRVIDGGMGKATGGKAAFVAVITMVLLALLATPGAATVTISSDATKNMKCSQGVCSPTKNAAVLNASDLESMLQTGNVTVTTTGSGLIEATTIVVDAALTWKSSHGLILTAAQSILFDAAVSVPDAGSLTLNDAGLQSLAFYNGASVTFTDLSSVLTINGNIYTLVGTISDLANAVTNNRNGFYALAANYDASGDGTYPGSPVGTDMDGTFEGLGNTISHVTINDTAVEDPLDGFFRTLNGTASNFGLVDISVTNAPPEGGAGAGTLAGNFGGKIWRCWATGAVSDGFNGGAGGLVAGSGGSIIQSWTDVAVTTNGSQAGGLAGATNGQSLIQQSFTIGSVTSVSDNVALGGLAGTSNGHIQDSYSTAGITMNHPTNTNSVIGGLVGSTQCCSNERPTLDATYATGTITAPQSACDHTDCIGGVIGYDNTGGQESYARNYWDLGTTNVANTAQGAGNVPNDPGLKGLSTRKLKAKLPVGFNKRVWAQSPGINGGYPYLIANPPPNQARHWGRGLSP